MKRKLFAVFTMAALAACAGPSLKLSQTAVLPQVKGGFDLMAADVVGKRLFVAAEDNNTVEVIDLAATRHLRSIGGLSEPKWIVYRPESERLYISCGGDGSVRVLDSRTFQPISRFQFKEKANNLRYDSATKELFVGVGKTFGALGIIDTVHNRITGEIRLANFPKQFEIAGNRLYVNVPEAKYVAVVDRPRRMVVETWPVTEASGNVPMGADPHHDRLFIGCEHGKLVVIESHSGRSVAALDIDAQPDSIYYDSRRNRLYVSSGAGFVDVITPISSNQYKVVDRIPTVKGAATSLFIPELDRFCLPVPQRDGAPAEIRIYDVN
jgi:DNA-binding beta-propeller fold protein YncE